MLTVNIKTISPYSENLYGFLGFPPVRTFSSFSSYEIEKMLRQHSGKFQEQAVKSYKKLFQQDLDEATTTKVKEAAKAFMVNKLESFNYGNVSRTPTISNKTGEELSLDVYKERILEYLQYCIDLSINHLKNELSTNRFLIAVDPSLHYIYKTAQVTNAEATKMTSAYFKKLGVSDTDMVDPRINKKKLVVDDNMAQLLGAANPTITSVKLLLEQKLVPVTVKF